MSEKSYQLAPLLPAARQESIDVLRGVAVLGILLMNIQIFAMIQAAYFNPTAFGDLNGINFAVWATSHLFADQKFMTIFSLLFGAGLALMAERTMAKGMSPAWLHTKRLFWLLCFGALHAYGLWYGDILVLYALCGSLVFWLHRRRPTSQLIAGFLMLAIGSGISVLGGLTIADWPPEAYQQALANWAPSAELVGKEVAAYEGGFAEQLAHRITKAAEFHTVVFLFWGLWRAGGLMLIGMALYRWGVFSAVLETPSYRRFVLLGFGAGLPLVGFGLYRHIATGWHYNYSFYVGAQPNYWGSILVALAYIGLVMLWVKSGRWQRLKGWMAAVGRMALSNYILQTVICTLLFYGHGLAWFGKAERWQQLLVVLGVWFCNILLSTLWLARFRYGPLEWLWRSLTYMQRQPFRRDAAFTNDRLAV